MQVFLAADHAGLSIKAKLLEALSEDGHSVQDMGAFAFDPEDDYPDVVMPFAHKVVAADAMGIVFAGSGQGEAMCANRVSGIRAAVFYGQVHAAGGIDRDGSAGNDGYDIVRLARKHNNANILSIGSRFVSSQEALAAVRIFLDTPFSGDERHERRLQKFA
jgi:ribose 5-phosphate isomerase B